MEKDQLVPYYRIQTRFVLYNILFLAGVIIFKNNRYDFKKLFAQACFNFVSNTRKFKQLNGLINKFILFYFGNNILLNIKYLVRSLNQFIHSISNFMKVSNENNAPRLRCFMYQKLSNFILLIQKIRLSTNLLIESITFNVHKLLNIPVQIQKVITKPKDEIGSLLKQVEQLIAVLRIPFEILSVFAGFLKSIFGFLTSFEKPFTIQNGITKRKNQISNLWKQVEQLIIILRMPFEIMSMIGRFLKSFVAFLKYLEKPRKLRR